MWERGVCVGEGSEEGREKALCLLVGLVYALWRETHARGVRAVRVSERDKNGRCDKKRNGGGGGALTNREECEECDARGDLCEWAEWRRARGLLTSAHARLVRQMRRGVTNAARVTNAAAVWQMRHEASHEGLAGREETGRDGKRHRERACVSA